MKNYVKALAPIAAIGALLATPVKAADNYPNRPVNMVVPFSAGGPTDNVARSLAEAMRQSLGETVVVENKGGAGGTLGISQVARAKPDGYSILLMHIGFTTSPSLYKSPGYDPLNGFQPLGLVVDVPMTIIARNDFPADTIQEFVEYVKSNQDKVTIANAGVGAASHLCGTLLMQALGVELLTIPYKGTGPAMNDLLGKQVDFMCDQTTNTTTHIQAGTVKAYAVTSTQRVPTLPDLPTMQEVGFEDFEVGIWHGLWAPAGTPQPVTDKLVKALQDGVTNDAFQKRMAALGANVLVDRANPEALKHHVEQQLPLWAEVFRKAQITPQ